MSSSIHKALLAIEPYMFYGSEIGKLRDYYRGRNYNNNRYLPDYCIKEDNTIGWAESYHQFTGEFSNSDGKHHFFNIRTGDRLLEEELAESGFEGEHSLLSGNKKWQQNLSSIIKNHFTIYRYDDFKRSIKPAQYVVIQLHYINFGWEDDWSLDVDLIGYLTPDLEFKEINEITLKNEN